MKKTGITIAVMTSAMSLLWAADALWIHRVDNITLGAAIEAIDSISVTEDGLGVIFMTNEGTGYTMARTDVEKVTLGDITNVVEIVYSGTDAAVVNPFAFEGVEISKAGGDVTVTSTIDREVEYRLSGTATEGSFKIYSESAITVSLDGVNLTNSDGAAINIQSKAAVSVVLEDGTTSSLVDGSKYSTPSGEDEKGCFFSEGELIFSGAGELNVTGNKKHGVVSDNYIEIKSGTVNVLACASDGIRVNDYFLMNGGTLTTKLTEGDGIDGDAGYIVINDGTIDIDVSTDDTKGIKADGDITVNGGDITLNVSAAQGKGFKTKALMTITGGTITATMTGDVVIEDNDPSYCTTIKTDGNFTMSGGSVNIVSTGKSGKGISVDGDASFTGGEVVISTSGDGDTYTDADGNPDSYSATCISVDGNLEIIDGVFNLSSSGSAGKCIKVDMAATVGDENHSPTITAKTSGVKFVEVQGTNEEDTDYANPKVFKAEGDLTINNGTLSLEGTQDGGEGLESKSVLTINGGTIEISTVDDCINAASKVVITGGKVYCVSSGNDAIDSNGSIEVSGGTTVAIGSSQPEGGFDCDQSSFAITGGVLVGIGGDNSTPTASACTQRSIVYSASLSKGTSMAITDNSGNHILTFTNPKQYNGSCKMVVSTPKFTSGGSYKIYTGGTTTLGDTFHELVTDGSYKSGSQSATFTTSSMVTTVNGSNRPR